MFWSRPALAGFVLTCGLFLTGAAVEQSTPPSPASPQGEPAKHAPAELFVMIDPSHGGDDPGATLAPGVREKDVTLSFARELKKELEERGIAVRMLRDSDVSLALERRAELANEQHPAIYVAVHAGPAGKGLRIYAPLLPSRQVALTGKFLPWDSAQSASIDRSRALAKSVAAEAKKHDLETMTLETPLRPLTNITTPAIAVELASDGEPPHSSASQKRLNAVASAIASGLAQTHSQWESRP